MSWRARHYVEQLLLLKQFARGSDGSGDVEWDFISVIIRAGINTDAAYACCREYIGRIVNAPGSPDNKIDMMDLLQIRVQALVGDGHIYRKDIMPLRDYWQQVIHAESTLLEKKRLDEQCRPGKGLREKMKSLFNAAQDGLLAKAAMDAGRFKKRPIKEIMKLWTDIVDTKGNEDGSPGSMETKSAP